MLSSILYSLFSIFNPPSSKKRALGFLSLCAVLLLANCGPNMRDQAKCQPLEGSSFFADGKCARDLPPNTVARGFLQADQPQTAGGAAGAPAGATSAPATGATSAPAAGATAAPPSGAAAAPTAAAGAGVQTQNFPFPITRDVLSVGHLSYDTFCSPCHGLTGNGDGMIVQRGFPAPPTFHQQRLRDVPPGYIYSVITNGFGRMYSYASRVKPDERWAIVAYIRALQLSQDATVDDVPPEERPKLEGASQ
jgi:Cytochrome C oxidase, cbb3-type, subunit III